MLQISSIAWRPVMISHFFVYLLAIAAALTIVHMTVA
jgi:hypothetical protein